MAEKEWKKLKCVFCEYEQASSSKKPRCSKCGSHRLNVIESFTAERFIKNKEPQAQIIEKKNEVETMTKNEDVSKKIEEDYKPQAKPAKEQNDDEETDDFDKDLE